MSHSPAEEAKSTSGKAHFARNCIPDSLLSLLRTFRDLRPRERQWYLRLRIAAALNLEPKLDFTRLQPGCTITFVCFGNIIRSAMAETLMRKELALRGFPATVCSCGTNARPGRAADNRATGIAPEFGVSLENHRASPMSQETLGRCAAIFVMDYATGARLLAQHPLLRQKVFLMPPAEDAANAEIPDPYMGTEADVRAAYKVIAKRINRMAEVVTTVHPGAQLHAQPAQDSHSTAQK